MSFDFVFSLYSLNELDLGDNARTLIDYLERNGAPRCPSDGNPAEWMLSVTKPASQNSEPQLDWSQIWRSSPECKQVKEELAQLKQRASNQALTTSLITVDDSQHREFVAPFSAQFWQVLKRVSKHFYRSPSYIYSKAALVVLSVS